MYILKLIIVQDPRQSALLLVYATNPVSPTSSTIENIYTEARFKRRTLHVPKPMQISNTNVSTWPNGHGEAIQRQRMHLQRHKRDKLINNEVVFLKSQNISSVIS